MSLQFEKVCIVGVGLIGGSIGLALRKSRLTGQVVGVGRNLEKLRSAAALGVLDSFEDNLLEGAKGADLIVACTPVQTIPEQLQQAHSVAAPHVLLTDVGSTKRSIVEAMESLGLGKEFVGSHPMAGSDKSGVEHATEGLFEGRTVIVTPTALSDQDRIRKIELFWKGLGARTLSMSPFEHDRSVAQVSHLPHVLAAALSRMTDPDLFDVAASGWRSTTRVAAGDAELWRQIIQENRGEILSAMRDFSSEWKRWERIIEQQEDDELLRMLQAAKQNRSQFD